MFTVIVLEISIAFELKLYSLIVINKIENRIESLRIEIESGHLHRYPALIVTQLLIWLVINRCCDVRAKNMFYKS